MGSYRVMSGVARFLFILSLFVVSAQLVCPIAPCPRLEDGYPPPLADDFVYIAQTDRWAAINQDDCMLLGKLDKNGGFQQKNCYPRGVSLSAAPLFVVINEQYPDNYDAYEFRSGVLVPGKILPECGSFLPEIDGKIIEFQEYKHSKPPRPIWNLPGIFKK
ncbi:hypothetical protein [Fimbriiglobus ruber]|uniref:hypothetical protein n=1 Tax=Fimbriiglobus ruber TaxID=1908690 RepID=UPI00117BA836|nr:hypothetical protein [Fimbriiglobus ruber]